jgi:transposase InsO family protein
VGGIPETIQSDNGKEFASHYFNTFCDVFGIKPVKSTTYHPQSQGLVEKFNGTLKTMLASYTNENQTDWSDYIHLCVFAYNTAVQKSIKISLMKLYVVNQPEQHFHHFSNTKMT